MGLSFAGYIGVGIIASAVFIMVAFLLMARYATRPGNQSTYKSIPNLTNPPQTQLTYKRPQAPTDSSYNRFYDSNKTYQPTVLYHGTSQKNAFDIYHTGAWLIGNSKPPAVWMADTIELSKIYASLSSDGAIVEVHVDSDLEIESRGGGVFIYQISDAMPNREYYKIEGLVPVGVLDTNGKKIM
jgi:hypothetical protein